MHSGTGSGPLTRHLQAVLGREGFVQLCQELGGTRIYIPFVIRSGNDILAAIGPELAARLSRALAPATIRVPLARRERALWFREQDLSNARIARRLGMTESGVIKLFGREAELPDRPGRAKHPAQLSLL